MRCTSHCALCVALAASLLVTTAATRPQRVAVSGGTFAFAFDPAGPRLVGESNSTFFWMPGVVGLTVLPASGSSVGATALVGIDESGDGGPAPNCSKVHCPPRQYALSVEATDDAAAHTVTHADGKQDGD